MAVNYRDLTVYKKARELVVGVDRLIKGFPRTPQADLIARQLFAAATSIGANIAEGKGKNSGREYLRYLTHAQGSANETDHWLHTALDCELAPAAKVEPLLALVLEILKILSAARATLSRQTASNAARPLRESPAHYMANSGGNDQAGDGSIAVHEPDWLAGPDWPDPMESDNP